MTFEQSERDRQHRRVNSRAQIQSNGMHKSRQTLINGVDGEIQKAMRQEREYERCDYRRTHCKALELLVSKYNRCSHMKQMHHSMYGVVQGTAYTEAADCVKYSFDHYGMIVQEHEFLVDPERFFSYDLVRSKNYSERPL